MSKRAKEKSINFFKVILGFFLAVLYFCVMFLLTKIVYRDYLYFKPFCFVLLLMINSFIIIAITVLIKKEIIKRLFKKTKNAILTLVIIFAFLCLPILFLKSGTVADANSIQKKNIFGQTTKTLCYTDIENIEISFRYGIQYDIEFASGDNVLLLGEELIFIKNFKSDKAMMQFDKTVGEYAAKTIYSDEYLKPNNVERFIDDRDVLNYFNDLFSECY